MMLKSQILMRVGKCWSVPHLPHTDLHFGKRNQMKILISILTLKRLKQFGISLCSNRGANIRNVNFETLYGGQFMLSTQLIILNYPVVLSHKHSTTVSLETYPLYSYHKVPLVSVTVLMRLIYLCVITTRDLVFFLQAMKTFPLLIQQLLSKHMLA